MLDKSSYTPLFRQVFDIICARIIEGVYSEGSKIPSQLEFANEFSVSMITVRQAFRELNEKGIISSQKGFGTIVFKKNQRYVAQHHTPRGLTKMANDSLESKIINILPQCTHIAARFVLGIGNTASICINRLRSVAERKIALEFSFLNPQFFQKTNWETEFKDNTSLYQFISDNYGYNIARSEESILPIIPRREIMNNLGMKDPTPIFFVKRETYIEGESKPIEYCENYMLPECYGKVICYLNIMENNMPS